MSIAKIDIFLQKLQVARVGSVVNITTAADKSPVGAPKWFRAWNDWVVSMDPYALLEPCIKQAWLVLLHLNKVRHPR